MPGEPKGFKHKGQWNKQNAINGEVTRAGRKEFSISCLGCSVSSASPDLKGWAVTEPELAAPSREEQQELRRRFCFWAEGE